MTVSILDAFDLYFWTWVSSGRPVRVGMIGRFGGEGAVIGGWEGAGFTHCWSSTKGLWVFGFCSRHNGLSQQPALHGRTQSEARWKNGGLGAMQRGETSNTHTHTLRLNFMMPDDISYCQTTNQAIRFFKQEWENKAHPLASANSHSLYAKHITCSITFGLASALPASRPAAHAHCESLHPERLPAVLPNGSCPLCSYT